MKYSKGDSIGEYTVSLPLNGGGNKEVYRVRNAEGRLLVLVADASALEKEVAALTELLELDYGIFYLMRYIPGETLESRLKRENILSRETALNIVNDILRQVKKLHAKGIFHKGISPSNVMLDLGTDPIRAYLVGYGKASRSGSADEDLKAIGALMQRMVSGKETDQTLEIPATMLADGFESETDMMEFVEKKVKTGSEKSLGPGFSAVAGMEELKQRMKTDVLEILKDHEEAKKYGLTIPNGMLLYGPPGCGKTFFAERFAEEAGYNYHYVRTSDLASVYLHGSQEKIAELFDKARRETPAIICFDEFDALAPRRDMVNNASHRAEVNEFLSQLDNCGRDGVFVIATTNRPDNIDPAVLRSGRMDLKIYIPVPDADARHALFELMLKDRIKAEDIRCEVLAEKTEGFLASDINAVVMAAARDAFRRKAPISQENLLQAISGTTPSLSKTDLNHYEKIRSEFEKRDSAISRIGFS